MLLIASFLFAVVTVPLCGGRLTRLADAPFRRGRLLVVALALQIAVISIVPGGPPWLWSAIHLATYGMLALVVAANRGLPGVPVLAFGGALNLVAVLANGGVMPATPEALRAAGISTDAVGFVNSGIVADPRLAVLGDIFAIPAGWPLANVFSIGDVLIGLGGWCAIHALCGSRVAGWTRRSVALDPPSRCATPG